eukprot:Plantae.Rhodophyta-Purpureofilum_apyrenoidigerum.ctg14159.p1 GENE.Plantae.Rhodophyta-Purpureofilum_apyrenoidigerum.ctg14159~~Plantae.Rhodophyta-Purpureofilum_apyrenoidigerum.ctg14159.p1  ORF type:complete len:222 (-),score=36.55 Plantae.Rhodophyta-Purpureofilum_apyrenoidigerum.ctg14159:146-811(-)
MMSSENKENAGPRAEPKIDKTLKLMQKLDRNSECDNEPLSPYTSWLPRYNDEQEEEEVLDLPDKLMARADAGAQVRDLKRCSVQIGQSIRCMVAAGAAPTTSDAAAKKNTEEQEQDRTSRAQGEIYVKSGFLIKLWRRRYGSVVEHSYFGSVLFLFKYDSDGNIEVQHSDMIALADTTVNLGKIRKANCAYRCEFSLKTAKKKYLFGSVDESRRNYWMRHM